ncbi:MAG: exodeoxyribonuclease VII small subunit [Myxococcota bacterium]
MARTPASSKSPSPRNARFEDALRKLEGIVERLEDGEIPLEDALKLYEDGVRLSRLCEKKLEEAEKKIETLSQGSGGKVTARPFEEDADGAE